MRPYTGRRRLAALVVCALVLFSLPVAAQQEVVPPAAAVSEGRADYVLGPGDLLTLRIIGVGEYKFLRVSNSGKLHLPYVGVIRVIDLTLQQLEDEVARILKEKGPSRSRPFRSM